MGQIMAYVLVACYALAWAWSSSSPYGGLAFLIGVSFVITLPYFLVRAFKMLALGLALGILIFLGLIILASMCPSLAGLLFALWGLWKGVALLGKVIGLLSKIPLILAGVFLYSVATLLPFTIRSTPFAVGLERHSPLLVTLPLAAMGACLMLSALFVAQKLNCRKWVAAAFMLGFGGYLIVFLITFVLPGPDGDVTDFGIYGGHNG